MLYDSLKLLSKFGQLFHMSLYFQLCFVYDNSLFGTIVKTNIYSINERKKNKNKDDEKKEIQMKL